MTVSMIGKLLFVLALFGEKASFCNGNQTALLDDLFRSYHSEVRPICGSDAPIEVKVGIAIRQVIELDEPKQIITVNAWLRLNWYDCQLRWNPSDYGGIDNLVLPFLKVWTPDITLYDNAGDELVGLKEYRPLVQSDGSVSYNFPTVISSLCRVDVTFFPFDTQNCALKFGSWAFHGLQLNVTNRAAVGDMSAFKTNSEWELVGVPLTRHVIYYGCCPEPYPDVTFYVILKRKPLFYLLNLLFPCVLITSVALLGFVLPPDSGEKVSLEITVLLSLAVFLLVVSETLPPTSENFPYIGIYFCLAMMLVTFSTILSVVVLNIHFKGQQGKKVPKWVRSFFLGTLGRIVCVRHESLVYPSRSLRNGDCMQNEAFVHENQNDINKMNQELNHNTSPEVTFTSTEELLTPTVALLKEQLALLKEIDKREVEKHKHEDMENEWKTVAMVMDRVFLILFFLLSVVITLGILLQCINN